MLGEFLPEDGQPAKGGCHAGGGQQTNIANPGRKKDIRTKLLIMDQLAFKDRPTHITA